MVSAEGKRQEINIFIIIDKKQNRWLGGPQLDD